MFAIFSLYLNYNYVLFIIIKISYIYNIYMVFLRSVCRLLDTASVVPSSPILITLMTEQLGSSETSVLTRATSCNIPEETILYSHRCGKPQILHSETSFSK
jgi:hypothetical protein